MMVAARLPSFPALARRFCEHAKRRRRERGRHDYWWRRGQLALAFEGERAIPLAEKASWGEGPWIGEPDWASFRHAGLPCLIKRAAVTGALCGYVSVPKGHPYWRKHYDAIPVEVHGGLTFSEQIGPHYWIGFDCGHFRDYLPAVAAQLRAIGAPLFPPPELREFHARLLGPLGEVYRDFGFVRAETERLAEQIAEAWPS